mmetsp:Transcript_52769/g.94702  ORF Transcript_52769/g.94702 Transcript_52769/m.94702 type:complete len:95 (-) Transcript_52769:126-410(-)
MQLSASLCFLVLCFTPIAPIIIKFPDIVEKTKSYDAVNSVLEGCLVLGCFCGCLGPHRLARLPQVGSWLASVLGPGSFLCPFPILLPRQGSGQC